MKRKEVDKFVLGAGITIAGLLIVASGLLFWAHRFVHTQVHSQLSAQHIEFPAKASSQLNALPEKDRSFVAKYAGQQLTTGKQAEVFANHYIAAHLQKIGGGKTYSELSAQAMANPLDQKLQTQTQTVFRGETLRGMLLNAYAFDTVAILALYASWVCLGMGTLLGLLTILKLRHASF